MVPQLFPRRRAHLEWIEPWTVAKRRPPAGSLVFLALKEEPDVLSIPSSTAFRDGGARSRR